MSTRLQTLIESARELSPTEQMNLISSISQSFHRNYQQTNLDGDFWEPKPLEQLIQAQKIGAITDIGDLKADFWPEEESTDDFIEYIYQQRREDRLRN